MKKVLSSVLAVVMLVSSVGAVSAFADEPKTTSSATSVSASEETGRAVAKLKENISKLEVKSFWQRNKDMIAKIAVGTLVAAVVGMAAHFSCKALQVPVSPTVAPESQPIIVDFNSREPISSATGFEPNVCLTNATDAYVTNSIEKYMQQNPGVLAEKPVTPPVNGTDVTDTLSANLGSLHKYTFGPGGQGINIVEICKYPLAAQKKYADKLNKIIEDEVAIEKDRDIYVAMIAFSCLVVGVLLGANCK